MFEITPKDVYTDEDLDWTEKSSRVNIEHEDESLQNVELVRTKVKNWKSYDNVYVGYPIWWGNEAWPIRTFVKNNDFSNKTVIPFCTSSSSDIGNSAKVLEKMTNTGQWLEGKCFSSGTTQSDVKDWLESLK